MMLNESRFPFATAPLAEEEEWSDMSRMSSRASSSSIGSRGRDPEDGNRDGIPDWKQDRNRDGVPDWKQDRNRDDVPDWKQDRNRDGVPDWRQNLNKPPPNPRRIQLRAGPPASPPASSPPPPPTPFQNIPSPSQRRKVPEEPLLLNNNVEEKPQSEPLMCAPTFPVQRDNTGVWNPYLIIALVYFGAAMFFLVGMNVKGFTLLGYPWVGNLLDDKHQFHDFEDGVIILQCLWCAHFVRKCAQALFLNNYREKISVTWFLCMIAYYGFFGLWIGFSINLYQYLVPEPAFMFLGFVIFAVGEIGSFVAYWMLRDAHIRPSGMTLPNTASSGNLPNWNIFNYMNSPQFLFEVVTWVGFYISAQTLAVGVFTLATILFVTLLAVAGCFPRKYTSVNKDSGK